MKPTTLQDKGKFRTNLNDKFYTDPTIASHCIHRILTHCPSPAVWIEPSAGNGSFIKEVPPTITVIGMDIEPEEKGIHKQDYLTWSPPLPLHSTTYLVFGNPPFGRQSSMAKAFIKKSGSFASVIAFILPKSFTKPSMYQAFDPHFHLIHTEDLPPNSFRLNGSPYDVPCVFQIWEKKDEVRKQEEKVKAIGFAYVQGSGAYDMACRRVGVYAGRCFLPTEKGFSIQSHYFITFDDPNINIKQLIEYMNAHTFPSNTVGPRSLSKSEINVVLNKYMTT